jgi:hypothetical protein
MKVMMVMIKDDVGASKILSAAAVDSLYKSPLQISSRGEVL